MDSTTKTNNAFTSYLSDRDKVNREKVNIRFLIREEGFETKSSQPGCNTLLFLVSGKMKIAMNQYPEYTSGGNTIVFFSAKSTYKIQYMETSEVVVAQFGTIHYAYGKKMFSLLGAIKPNEHIFPALPINGIIREYLREVRQFIANPLNKGCKCEVYEDEFFIVFGVYYNRTELAQLFFPILEHPELIQ